MPAPSDQSRLSTEELLEKLDVDCESPQRRRRSFNGLLHKTASISRLFPGHQNAVKNLESPVKLQSPRKLSNSLGNSLSSFMNSMSSLIHDSSTEMSLGSSLGSIDDIEFNDLTFVKDLDKVIEDLEERKREAGPKIECLQELARARYENGNELGALLSMRKVHRVRMRKAYYSGARYQLVQMRERMEAEMNEGNFDFDFHLLYTSAQEIVTKAKTAQCRAPPDKELRRELYKEMGFLEI